jgi:hypothetical protein
MLCGRMGWKEFQYTVSQPLLAGLSDLCGFVGLGIGRTEVEINRKKVGLLLNFNVVRMKDGIQRMVNNL